MTTSRFTHTGDYLEPAPPSYFTVNMEGLKASDEFARVAGSADFSEGSRWTWSATAWWSRRSTIRRSTDRVPRLGDRRAS